MTTAETTAGASSRKSRKTSWHASEEVATRAVRAIEAGAAGEAADGDAAINAPVTYPPHRQP